MVEGSMISYRLVKSTINKYLFASALVADSIVLDIACNDGYGSLCMAEEGAQFVVGCDISKNCCIKAKKASGNYENCEFAVCDARKLPFKNRAFDVVVSLDTIEHLDNYTCFLSECARTMKRYSTMICSTPNRKATSMLFKKPLNPSHIKEFYVREIVSQLRNFFEYVSLYGQEYSLTIVMIMKQLQIKLMNFISSFIKRVDPGKFMKFILKCARCLLNHEPKGKMPYSSYETFVDKEYEVTIFKDSILYTSCHIVCVSRNPRKFKCARIQKSEMYGHAQLF